MIVYLCFDNYRVPSLRFGITDRHALTRNSHVLTIVNMHLSDKQLILALKAVADPARLKILRLLKQKGQCSIGKGVGMCACDVQDHVTLSQPTISHHMAILRKAGLVQAEKHGLWMWYRRDEKSLKELAQAMNAEI
jgi:ArsR family transcriptional regulator, arsenate/arsenite/antimonite-responsive transcriptional repressor